MRETVRDRERLEHIKEAITRILDYSDSKTVEELTADTLKYYGIVKNIEIIGEAAYKLTRAYCREHPETPWEFIAKMRHVLVHDYYQIDPETVLKVIQEDLPTLYKQISCYLLETDWESWNKNETVVSESATQKSLIQTASRMKQRGYEIKEIQNITGLNAEDIERL